MSRRGAGRDLRHSLSILPLQAHPNSLTSGGQRLVSTLFTSSGCKFHPFSDSGSARGLFSLQQPPSDNSLPHVIQDDGGNKNICDRNLCQLPVNGRSISLDVSGDVGVEQMHAHHQIAFAFAVVYLLVQTGNRFRLLGGALLSRIS
jgi:hypothetical protein